MMIPTAYFGVGERGRAIVKGVYALTRRRHAAQLPALLFISALQQGTAYDPEFAAEWRLPEDTEAGWAKAAERLRKLLATANLQAVPDVRGHEFDIVFVGDLREDGVGEAMARLGRRFADGMRQVFPALDTRLEAYLPVPSGDCPQRELVTKGLHGLARAEDAPWAHLFVISNATKSHVLLEDGECAEMLAQLLTVRTHTDLANRQRALDRSLATADTPRLHSAGLSLTYYPAEELLAERAQSCALTLVDTAEGTVGTIAYQRAETAATDLANELTIFGLDQPELQPGERLRIMLDSIPRGETTDSLRSELDVGAFLFHAVPFAQWPMALANLHAFISETRMKRILEALEANSHAVAGSLLEKIKSAVDTRLRDSWDLDYAKHFLSAFNERVRDTQKRLVVHRSKAADHGLSASGQLNLDLSPTFNKLADMIGSIPSNASIWTKSLLTGIVGSVPLMLILQKTGARVWGEAAPAWFMQPVQLSIGFAAAFLIAFFFGVMAYLQARKQAHDFALQCMQTMQQAYRAVYDEKLESYLPDLLETLLCYTMDEASLQREYPQYAGENEFRNLRAYAQRRAGIRTLLDGQAAVAAAGTWRLRIDRYFEADLNLGYKKLAAPDWPLEVSELLSGDFTANWRTVDAGVLTGKIKVFIRPGLQHILEYTLAHYLEAGHITQEGVQRWVNDTIKYSAVCLDAPSHHDDAAQRLTAFAGGEGHPLIAACATYGRQAEVTPCLEYADPYAGAMAQTIWYGEGEMIFTLPFCEAEAVELTEKA
ncbi:MAG: hypothetical protein ACYDCO_18150 [Armatimonadota bacterium]